METKLLETESSLLGLKVLKLENWQNIDDVAGFIPAESPAYVYCEISATDLVSIHCLEEAGYFFSEFRIQSILKTTGNEYSTKGFYPYKAEIITDESVLNKAINILNQNSCDDRFSNDPFINVHFAAKRNIHNLKKSFQSWPKEFLLGIFNSQTSELIAFRSGAIFNKTESQLFQYGVSATADFHHTADMLETFTIQYLQNQGILHIHAVTTGFNIPELNRLTRNHEFKVDSSKVLLRKVFR